MHLSEQTNGQLLTTLNSENSALTEQPSLLPDVPWSSTILVFYHTSCSWSSAWCSGHEPVLSALCFWRPVKSDGKSDCIYSPLVRLQHWCYLSSLRGMANKAHISVYICSVYWIQWKMFSSSAYRHLQRWWKLECTSEKVIASLIKRYFRLYIPGRISG